MGSFGTVYLPRKASRELVSRLALFLRCFGDDDGAYPRIAGALQYLGDILLKPALVQICADINEHNRHTVVQVFHWP